MPGFVVYGDDGSRTMESHHDLVEVVVRLLTKHATPEQVSTLAGLLPSVHDRAVDRDRGQDARGDTAVVPLAAISRNYVEAVEVSDIDAE